MTSPYGTEIRHNPLGRTCGHFLAYRLTCDEYDGLRARASGHCEVCGIAEKDAPRRMLVIDHFHSEIKSFVRGLICIPCNVGVMACIDGMKAWGKNRALEAKAREYERNSWQQPCAAVGLELAARTEMLPAAGPHSKRLPVRWQPDPATALRCVAMLMAEEAAP